MNEPAEILLAGPRGRRLCLELAVGMHPDIRQSVFRLAHSLDPASGTSRVLIGVDTGEAASPLLNWSTKELAAAIVSLDLAHLEKGTAEEALERSVDAARYWQEPDGEDILAGLPEIREELFPIAGRVGVCVYAMALRTPTRRAVGYRLAICRRPGTVAA